MDTSSNYQNNESIRETVFEYVTYWKWFLISVFLTVFLAFLYLRFTPRIYKTEATILIKDEEKGGKISEMSAFEDLGFFSGMTSNNIENEVEILRSKRLIGKVIQELGLTVHYFQRGRVKTSEIYDEKPIILESIKTEDYNILGNEDSYTLEINPLSESEYQLIEEENGIEGIFKFGERIQIDKLKFIIFPNPEYVSYDGDKPFTEKKFIIKIAPLKKTIENYQNLLNINQKGKKTSIIKLAIKNSNPAKARDIINNLIRVYNKDAIDDKNQISDNTLDFINKRLQLISKELDSVETTKEAFKVTNNITDISSEAELFVKSASEYERQNIEINTQLTIANSIIRYLQDESRGSDLLPVNLGIADEGLVENINEYNKLVLNRNRILKSSTEKNPAVTTLNDQIDPLKANILSGLRKMKESLLISRRGINKQLSGLNSQISSIPSQEKGLRGIIRQQNVIESLYLFLLQKREETSISLAVTAPIAKIIDAAFSTNLPVAPNKKMVLLGALALGLLLPAGIIYGKGVLDTKINSKEDVVQLVKTIPIVGEIPSLEKGQSEVVAFNDRSILAESFRILRTNLSYFQTSKAEKGNLIFVTSAIKAEGKTFVAFNLALTMASSGKKVMIVGSDLRNPRIDRFVGKNFKLKGLSDYLSNASTEVEHIKNSLEQNQREIDIILSGRIPPNPAELLMNGRFEILMRKLQDEYDYIIVDTAPTLLVTDTLLISPLADLTLFVCRAGHTDKNLISFPEDLKAEGKLQHLAMVVNDVDYTNSGYGRKYGYSYGRSEDKWYHKYIRR